MVSNIQKRKEYQDTERALLKRLFGVENCTDLDTDLTHYHVVRDPKGGIRWLFPMGSEGRIFLSLYNPNTIRGRFLKSALRVGTYTPALVPNIISHQILPDYFLSPLKNLMAHRNLTDWALFTGTPGNMRKGVFALGTKGKAQYFLKVPCSPETVQKLDNELQVCQAIYDQLPKSIHIPKAEKNPHLEGILLSNVKPRRIDRISSFPNPALDWLSTFCSSTEEESINLKVHFLKELSKKRTTIDISHFRSNFNQQQINEVLSAWDILFEELTEADHLQFMFSHGDFTPWNMYQNRQELYLYDFEMAGMHTAWYDLFHFHYQKGILLSRIPFQKIHAQVSAFQDTPLIRGWLNYHDQSWRTYHLAYLLKIGIDYLARYAHETDHVVQTYWIIDLLHEAYNNFTRTWKPQS
ncbi:MAG: phosphotransferase [Bacteroidota bacterium]